MSRQEFRGTVVSWDAHRGFGFIAPSDGRRNLFAHISECDENVDELTPGQCVKFEIAPDNKRPGAVMAVNIEIG